MNRRRRDWLQRYRLLLVALVVAAVGVGVLTPGRLPWANATRWRAPEPGLRFGGISQLLSDDPIVSLTGEMTLEVWLVPGFNPQVGNQEIISFYDDQKLRPLLLGQFPRGFILRGREDNPTGDPRDDSYIGIHEVGLESSAALQHLAVTVDREGAKLHVNGRATSLHLPKTIAQSGEPFGGHLLIGSSNTGWRVWVGGMLGVAVYERVLDDAELRAHALQPARLRDEASKDDPSLLALYPFEEAEGRRTRSAAPRGPDLTFPKLMTRPTRRNFLSFYTGDPSDLAWIPLDVGVNIAMFMPLGFLIAWKQHRRGIALAVVIGFGLSLAIEILQSFIQGRSSSLIDLGSNSLGALAGAFAASLLGTARERLRPRSRS
jgi:hypothetical protein